MKIDKFTRLITALDYGSQGQSSTKAAQEPQSPPTPAVQQNTEAVSASVNLDLNRAQRVENIKQQVNQNSYKVDTTKLARSFFEEIFG